MTEVGQARKIMGKNFIGPAELTKCEALNLLLPQEIPMVNFSTEQLTSRNNDFILVFGIESDKNGDKITINNLRTKLGFDPAVSEPCFYNQDWYLKEKFATEEHLDNKWYLIQKNISNESRGIDPADIQKLMANHEQFPSAILTVFTFFSYFFATGIYLWKHDFMWCSDLDNNSDRIYTGRYFDPNGVNKNGFNVHRHLSLRPCYGAAVAII